MQAEGDTIHTNIKIARWIGRALSAILFLLMGAFFLDHVGLLLVLEEGDLSYLLRIQILHLALLVGYILIWRWERLGSIVIVVSALLFFFFTVGTTFWLFVFISVSPVFFFGYSWIRARIWDSEL